MTRRNLLRKTATGAGTAFISGPALATAQSLSGEQSSSNVEVTRYVVDFILKTGYADLPADVIELGKKSILDGLGLAFSGAVAETGELGRAYVRSLGVAHGGATVVGTSMKVPPRFAAFLNGVGIHADDYDDTQLAVAKDRVYGLLTHPTSPVLPPALAVTEAAAKSGRDLMLAYHIGVEVETKIAEAIAPRHYEDGFHSIGTCGAFGSCAAVAKLRELNAERTARRSASRRVEQQACVRISVR